MKIAALSTDSSTIESITAALGRSYAAQSASDLAGVESIIAAEPELAAVILDGAACQRIGAIDLLLRVRQTHPRARRILLSDHSDLGLVVEAVHTGAVHSIVHKPIHPPELQAAVVDREDRNWCSAGAAWHVQPPSASAT